MILNLLPTLAWTSLQIVMTAFQSISGQINYFIRLKFNLLLHV